MAQFENRLLSKDQVMAAYDEVSPLYPHIPSMSAWRSWELAAYRQFPLEGATLDIGCGDGRYFSLAWPGLNEVTGVDIDPVAIAQARASGIYRTVHESPAHQLTLPAGTFRSAFANCSLEHMDALPAVLRNVHTALAPGGLFLCSVVTDRFITWSLVPLLLRKLGLLDRAAALQREHEHYHHLVNPFTPERWAEELCTAGFSRIVHIPIVPEITGRMIVLLDQLWHVPQAEGGELGSQLHQYFASLPEFVGGYRDLLAALLRMEVQPAIGAGAVFAAWKE